MEWRTFAYPAAKDQLMISRDLVINTLNHRPVDRVPRDLWPLPEVETDRADELDEIDIRFPRDIIQPDFKYPPGERSRGKPGRMGQYTDAWGCTWQVDGRDAAAELKQRPLADPEQIAQYKPPFELLDGARLGRVNQCCETTSCFVLARTEVKPFGRLCSLRGSEAATADLAHGTNHIRSLLGMLHDFFCREMEMWADTDVDGVAFRDDLGTQAGLLIDPATWREIFKPFYREYCKILHAADKFVFFHSDGNIYDIFADLVKIGVDAVNSQLFLMDFERLARRFRGRVTFWGEIDRQHVLPFGSLREVREAVRRVRRELDFGAGGVIAQCQWEPSVPIEKIIAVFGEWMAPLPIHV